MNRRQKKKTFKKKYGHNPHRVEIVIKCSVEQLVTDVVKAIDKMSERVRRTVNTIQTMPEEEFEVKMAGMARSGNVQSVALARSIRQRAQTEEGKENGNKKSV